MVASWSQVTVFLASCTWKSWERNGKKANKFCHWLISRLRVCGRTLQVRMHICLCMHDYLCNMPHTLANVMHTLARIVAWNSEPPPVGSGCSSPPYFVAVANMYFKQMWKGSVVSKASCTFCEVQLTSLATLLPHTCLKCILLPQNKSVNSRVDRKEVVHNSRPPTV